MNRLGLIAATGFLMLALTACGEQTHKRVVETKTTNTATEPVQAQPASGQDQNQDQKQDQNQ